jgi:hypothetical protein
MMGFMLPSIAEDARFDLNHAAMLGKGGRDEA